MIALTNGSQVNQWHNAIEGLKGWVIEDVIPAEQRQMLFWLPVGHGRDANDILPQAPRRYRESNTNDYLSGHS